MHAKKKHSIHFIIEEIEKTIFQLKKLCFANLDHLKFKEIKVCIHLLTFFKFSERLEINKLKKNTKNNNTIQYCHLSRFEQMIHTQKHKVNAG